MLSDEWKKEAINRFPEFSLEDHELWETPYLCWFSLRNLFEESYKAPRNDELIGRIYAYSDWCLAQPKGANAKDDLATCVAVCFFEHIPEIDEARTDMPKWFTRNDVIGMRKIFSYHGGDEGFEKILQVFEKS